MLAVESIQAQYAEAIAAFKAANPQPERESPSSSGTVRRPQSAYALYLADYKRQYKVSGRAEDNVSIDRDGVERYEYLCTYPWSVAR